MQSIGKMLIAFGVLLTIAGVVVYVLGRLGVGHLPGDIIWRRGNVTVFVPIVSMIVVSIVLTIVLNLLFRR